GWSGATGVWRSWPRAPARAWSSGGSRPAARPRPTRWRARWRTRCCSGQFEPVQDLAGPLREQLLGERAPDRRGLVARAAPLAAEDRAAIELADEPHGADRVAVDDGVARHRRLAAAAEPLEEGALGGGAGRGRLVVERAPHERDGRGVVGARLDGEDALPDRRHEIEPLRDPVAQAEADEAGGGEHDGVVLAGVELAQA